MKRIYNIGFFIVIACASVFCVQGQQETPSTKHKSMMPGVAYGIATLTSFVGYKCAHKLPLRTQPFARVAAFVATPYFAYKSAPYCADLFVEKTATSLQARVNKEEREKTARWLAQGFLKTHKDLHEQNELKNDHEKKQ